MSNHFFTLALLCVLPCFLKAQNTPVFLGQPIEIPDNDNLNKTFLAYHVFDLRAESLRMHLQEESNGEKTFDLQLPGVGTWSLALVSSGLIPETYRLRVDDGQKITELPGPGDIAWKGRVVGSSQSDVRLTVADGFIFGSIQVGASIWFVEPLSDLLPGTVADRYIVYRTSDVLPNPELKCGVTEAQEKKTKENRKKNPERSENMVGQCKHVELAIASAHDMFVRYGTVAAVETHNIGVMNAVGTDYDTGFDDEIYFLIATQYVSTTTTSSLDVALTASTDAEVLLNNFTTWGNNAANFGVTFDLGQLWTTRNFCFQGNCGTIGLAWVGTVCGNSRYHILEDYLGSNPSGSAWQLRVLTSHEIGHNFDCDHDGAGSGFIMAPSVNNSTTWSAASITNLNAFLGTISCLSICGANFESTTYTGAEWTSSTYLSAGEPSCEMGYTELSIPITYSGSTAGGSVTVSVTGGTATEDLDFDIPSNTVNFPAGSTGQTVNFIIRVWNDAIVEGNETINLDLTGTLAGDQNTTTITLVSNDLDPVTDYYRFGLIGGGNTGISAPFRGSVSDCRSQIVFSVAELTAAGFVSGDIINGLALEVTSKGSTQPYSGFTIKMKYTTLGTNSTAALESTSGFTTVYSASHTTAVGWNKFNYTQGFAWNGTSNVAIEFCYDNASGTGNDNVRSVGTPTARFVSATSGSGCSLPNTGQSWFSFRPNTRLYKGTEIAITLNDEADTNLKNGQTAYFKDEQNEFIVAVKQNSGTDVGCINVKVDRAGNGNQSAAWLPGFLISTKTFLVTASNPSATYDITLYFSKAEMTAWGGSTGSLNILKSSGPIADATAANSSINTTITRATFGPAATPDAYYSYKGTFTEFSGFALTNATTVAPVEWLYFSGKWAEKAAALTWATAAERDNRGFDVERSADGVSFEKIGFVPGRGTISVPQPYYFDDEKALRTGAEVLYYRLRQLDTDGTHAYSNTVPVALPGSRLAYLLYPNPTRSTAMLQVLGCDECSATLTLTDAAGRVVMRSETTGTTTPIDLSGLPSGVYLAEIVAQDGGRWQTKLVKL